VARLSVNRAMSDKIQFWKFTPFWLETQRGVCAESLKQSEMDWGPSFDLAAVMLPTFLGIVGVLVSIRAPTLASRRARRCWYLGLVAFGIVVSAVTFEQQRLAREATQKELTLNYIPSVAVVHQDHRLYIYNEGKSDLYMWGNKLTDLQTVDPKPRIIPSNANYYMFVDQVEAEILRKLGNNGEVRVPFELYLSNVRNERYIATFELLILVRNGAVSIHSQMTGISLKNW
jgi:uncharacterized membrane protein